MHRVIAKQRVKNEKENRLVKYDEYGQWKAEDWW